MKKYLIVCSDGVEETECLTTVDYCRRAGMDLTLASVGTDRMVAGSHGIRFEAEALFADLDPAVFDGIILPGGPGHTVLKAHEGLRQAVREFYAAGKLVAAICASPSVLAEWGVLKGRRATVYPGMETAGAGVDWTAEAAVTDGHVITGQGPSKAGDFALAVIRYAAGEEAAAEVAADVLMG